jgi:hypothetical protein
MIGKITLDNISFKNNPALFSEDINLEITFTISEILTSPIGWKIIYVGSALSEEKDQILE